MIFWLRADVRITDRRSGDGQDEPATVSIFRFPVVPCAATASDATGGTCSLSSSFDAILPGAIAEGSRAVWELGALEVLDGGADGDVQTAPERALCASGIVRPVNIYPATPAPQSRESG